MSLKTLLFRCFFLRPLCSFQVSTWSHCTTTIMSRNHCKSWHQKGHDLWLWINDWWPLHQLSSKSIKVMAKSENGKFAFLDSNMAQWRCHGLRPSPRPGPSRQLSSVLTESKAVILDLNYLWDAGHCKGWQASSGAEKQVVGNKFKSLAKFRKYFFFLVLF